MLAWLIAALCLCSPTTGPYEPAVRLDPPVVVATGPPPTVPFVMPSFSSESEGTRCSGADELLWLFSPGWDVQRMSRIMFRESRCQPSATNSCCSGLFQIHRIHIPNLAPCGVYSRSDLYDPVKNICSAAIVFQRAGGMSPWNL